MRLSLLIAGALVATAAPTAYAIPPVIRINAECTYGEDMPALVASVYVTGTVADHVEVECDGYRDGALVAVAEGSAPGNVAVGAAEFVVPSDSACYVATLYWSSSEWWTVEGCSGPA